MSDSRDFIVGRKIRVALVGCGRIAQRHLEAIAAHRERLELTAVCDAEVICATAVGMSAPGWK